MSDELLLGIDVGTTNVKAALATADGRVVGQAQSAYGTSFPRPGWAEQDPRDWWAGVVATTRAAVGSASAAAAQVRGIAVSGQGCAATLIDGAGNVVRPAIIWMDTRSEPQCERLRATCTAELLRVNGKQPAPYNADPALMWLQEHEPGSIAAARCSLTTTGYVTFRLSGVPVENHSGASILFAYDLAAGCWSDDLVAAFGLPRRLYPALAASSEVVGGLTPEAAGELGLRPGIAVVAGGEDTSSAGLAMGVVVPGQALLSLGTAGTIYVVQEQPTIHADLLAFRHVLPGQILLGGSMAAVGAALQWCRQLMGGAFDYPALTAMAETVAPGADGLIFLPYLSGELQPINDGHARGVFFGLGMNSGPAQIVRAALEGSAFAIAHNLEVAAEAGARIDEIRATGGPTRSGLWCQIIADVTGRPVATLADDTGAPLGNALLAATGTGLVADTAATAARAAVVARTYEPRGAEHGRYAELFGIYRRLYPRLRDEFRALAALPPFIPGVGLPVENGWTAQ